MLFNVSYVLAHVVSHGDKFANAIATYITLQNGESARQGDIRNSYQAERKQLNSRTESQCQTTNTSWTVSNYRPT
jgi:hypothetical protein